MKDKDIMANLYDRIIVEQMTPLAVKSSAKGDGETGGLEPGDLPADASSTTEVQKGTGAGCAKNVKAPEEAEEKLNPVNKNKGTDKTATKKQVTAIKDSVEPRKSFMDLYTSVIKEEGETDIESPAYSDEDGDFPETEGEIEPDADAGMGGEGEGEIYAQLSDLFAKLAEIKGAALGGVETGEEDLGAGDELGTDDMPPAAEGVRRSGRTIEEMKSEPEPREFNADIKARQLPTKLAGKGVVKCSDKKAAVKGNDKSRTGELEDGPEGMKHDKSKYSVKGDGPIHKAKNASFLES